MKIGTVIGLAATLIACGSRLTFETKIRDLRKAANRFARGKEPEDSVKVTAPGEMLGTPAAVPRVTRAQADWSTPEQAVASVISANVAGDLPWIVQNYVPEERPEAGKQLTDPMAAARTRAYYRNLGTVKLIGWVNFDDRRIMFLRGDDGDGDSSIATVVLAKTIVGWRQTIAMNSDDRYDVVIAALHQGGVR